MDNLNWNNTLLYWGMERKFLISEIDDVDYDYDWMKEVSVGMK